MGANSHTFVKMLCWSDASAMASRRASRGRSALSVAALGRKSGSMTVWPELRNNVTTSSRDLLQKRRTVCQFSYLESDASISAKSARHCLSSSWQRSSDARHRVSSSRHEVQQSGIQVSTMIMTTVHVVMAMVVDMKSFHA